ncbi:hypothetical protein N7523_000341 [Penicillium sp. IBT 18751x]|nr:hypothetical protein N7523_000341 [Penicillium sp. IBT 18751x]
MKPELKATWTPAINVLTFFMLVTSILSVFTRLGTKYFMVRKWGLDDFMSIGAMFACVGQSIAVSIATKSGLGQHLLSLSDGQRVSMMKAQYAANILFIASMACSKLALIMFIRSLTPATLDRRFALGLGVFVLLWTIAGVFTAAFQCSVPDTWDYLHGKCFHLVAWWNYLGITNILSEVGIVAQALLVILRIQADFHKKAVLASVFLLRIIVVVAIICQLAYAHENEHTIDPSWDTWTVAISTQMAQSLSIVTACSPQFKPFLDSLRSSGMSLGDSSYESKQRTYGATSYYKSSRAGRAGDTRSDTHELVSIHGDGNNHTTVTSMVDCDSESQSSQAQIIREVRTWTVTAQRE